MSNKTNLRRSGAKRTETGPRYESKNPGAGCNSTHVARGRTKWKRLSARLERRTGRGKGRWGFRDRPRPKARDEGTED